MEQERPGTCIDTRHVDVLDGVRAIAILVICWYHIWQQSWLTPYVKTPFLAFLGKTGLSFDVLPRTGYLWVDLMLLLSGFCLFLPYARAALSGAPLPGVKDFYKKRLVRILPSYVLCVLVIFFSYSLPAGGYASAGEALRDLVAQLTFTQVFSAGPYLFTKINGVLWTVAIEMQFYLLFPFLARFFIKRPAVAYLAMLAVGAAYTFGFALPFPDSYRLTVNQLPAFFPVFGNGMLGAYLFVLLSTRTKRNAALSLSCTLALFCFAFLLVRLFFCAAGSGDVQEFQLRFRYPLSLCFGGAVFCAALSCRGMRFLLSNRVVRFFAAISYNLYIWHQWLAVRFKAWHIPYWTGDTLPNVAGNRTWQLQYTALCFFAAIALAALLTYCFEQPLARLLLKNKKPKPEEPVQHEIPAQQP